MGPALELYFQGLHFYYGKTTFMLSAYSDQGEGQIGGRNSPPALVQGLFGANSCGHKQVISSFEP